MDAENICWMSAVDTAKAIRDKEVSPVEVTEAYLQRIEEVNPKINAYVTLVAEMAMEEAREAEKEVSEGAELGPLHGVPLAVKDKDDTKGIRTTLGSRLFEDNVPEKDAVVIQRLKNAGSIILGKTNLPELGLVGITDNVLFGPTRNPWDTSKTSGGSSGGSAAAVAAGLAPIATGTDGGGSIRIPCSLCGVVGLKPQFGRVPRYPKIPGWDTLEHQGSIARTVADAALMLDVIKGPHEGDRYTLPPTEISYFETLKPGAKGLKVAYSPDLGYAVVDPEVAEIVARAAGSLAELGCEVEEVDLDLPNMEMDLLVTVICETFTAFEKELAENKDKLYPLYVPFLDMAPNITGTQIVKVQYRREELWDALRPLFEEYDLLVTPTTACAAFEIEELGPLAPKEIAGHEVSPAGWVGFTFPFNFTGQPALTLRCGFTSGGLPIGMQLVSRRYDEPTVLRAAAAFEEANPSSMARPEL